MINAYICSMRTQGKARLSCRICRVNYEKRLSRLTKEVDVYCDWIDECERLNEQHRFGLANADGEEGGGLGFNAQAAAGSAAEAPKRRAAHPDDLDDEDDDEDEEEAEYNEDLAEEGEEEENEDIEEEEEEEEKQYPKLKVRTTSDKKEKKKKHTYLEHGGRLKRNADKSDSENEPVLGKRMATKQPTKEVGYKRTKQSAAAYLEDSDDGDTHKEVKP